jgi:hypothetical protein
MLYYFLTCNKRASVTSVTKTVTHVTLVVPSVTFDTHQKVIYKICDFINKLLTKS